MTATTAIALDALAATATLALLAEPLLLTNPTQLSDPTRRFLWAHAHAQDDGFLDVFGGPPAVSDSVVEAADLAFTLD